MRNLAIVVPPPLPASGARGLRCSVPPIAANEARWYPSARRRNGSRTTAGTLGAAGTPGWNSRWTRQLLARIGNVNRGWVPHPEPGPGSQWLLALVGPADLRRHADSTPH